MPMHPKYGPPLEWLRHRFEQVPLLVSEETSCWAWPASPSNPYGTIGYKGKRIGAHRAAWMLAHDQEIPAGMVILHSCDNPPCVNPGHLNLGTYAENTADMMAKSRNRNTSKKFVDNHPVSR